MEPKKEDLTEEQIKQIGQVKKLYLSYKWKLFISLTSYLAFLFSANLVVVLVDLLYIHKQQFVFFMSVGTAMITIVGLIGTMKEHYDILAKEFKKITDNQ